GRAIAYQWMRHHTHDYSASPKNAGILSAWITKKHRQGEWSVENLEAAFDATKNHLKTIAVKTSPPPKATKESLPEWGILTRKRIAEMDRTEYKWLLKNPQFKAIPLLLFFTQMCVKPKKLNVSGFPSPRRFRLSIANGPNSSSRVFCGCSSRLNLAIRSSSSARN